MENNEFVEETTENVEAQTTEEIEEAEETDTEEVEDTDDVEETEEKETTEEVEEPVEEEKAEKKYSDDELDEIIKRKLSRYKKKIEREYNKKYSRLENVVNAGLGTNNVEDATDKLADFYKENGIDIPSSNQSKFTDEEIELIANAEADKFIKDSTYKELADEVEDIEETMKEEELTEREQLFYQRLKNELDKQNDEKAVLSLGISLSDLEKEEVKDYFKKLNPNLSTKEKYEMYLSSLPKKETKKIGSMKSKYSDRTKNFISEAEYDRMTDKEIEENLDLIRKSMYKW